MGFNKIGIVGAGSVGGILAAHLVKIGQRTIVCDVDERHLEACRTDGIVVSDLREMVVKLPEVRTDIRRMKDDNIDILFLAVKSAVMEKVAPFLKEIFHEGMLVVSFQNGLGNEDFLASYVGEKHVARVVVNYAGNLVGPGKVRMTFFTGSNYIGSLHQDAESQCQEIARLLTEAGLETKFTTKIKTYEWEKVILNCGLSPISALTCLTMKDIMEGPKTRKLVEGVLRECIAVAEASGIKFQEGFLSFCMGYLDKAGRHKPSMLVDVENCCGTEIGYLNQKICEHGEKLGIDTPLNDTITTLVIGRDRCNEMERGKLEEKDPVDD